MKLDQENVKKQKQEAEKKRKLETEASEFGNDVLFGRGAKKFQKYAPGCIAFNKLIDANREDYQEISKSKCAKPNIAKSKIVGKVIDEIKAMDPPGRFLGESNGGGFVLISDDSEIRKKVRTILKKG
ncbi:hypothetical protein CTEN210_03444 [Chaetoceros tenuissimus]|uniref:DUF6824 domain-containing protein n=1 Tax=Chaetoceros tenuissimus TaxID=426638 RepID=A0AAD3H1Z9_9STRA|nr:hypothetical protein CTEN210_03444 [Chaetoceros tenuissimus]